MVIGKWQHRVVGAETGRRDPQRAGYQRLPDDEGEAEPDTPARSAQHLALVTNAARTPSRLLRALLQRPASGPAANGAVPPASAGSPDAAPVGGPPLLRFCLQRQHGVFGMKLDAFNRVMVVGGGSAAEQCGLRVGDVVVTCDGQPLAGELSQAMRGRERAELGVRRGTGAAP